MIPDHKMLAAGDDTPENTPIRQPYRPIEQHDLKPSPSRCRRCGGQRYYFKPCPSCEDLDKIPCSQCSKPFGAHRLHVRGRTLQRIWVHKDNWLIFCKPDNDPVKQELGQSDNPSLAQFVWKDMSDERMK